MSTMKHEMPSCLAASGLVRARQMPQSASLAIDVHTFWPFNSQPPSTAVARVDSDARSEPAPGSLNSWHQPISPRSVGMIQRSLLFASVPCTIRFGSAHAPTPMFGSRHLRGAELLFDHEELERLGVAAPRRGPARRDVARRRRADCVAPSAEGRAISASSARSSARNCFGLIVGAEVDREPPARAAHRRLRGPHPPVVGRAGQLVQRHRAAEVDVRVVLPREPDAAEGLHAVLGVQRTRRRTRARPRRRSRARAAGSARSSAARGRVPGRGAGELDAGEHLRAAVLHALELADRPAELHAHLRVLGRGVDAPLRDADRLRREQRRRERAGPASSVRFASLRSAGRRRGRGARRIDAREAAGRGRRS